MRKSKCILILITLLFSFLSFSGKQVFAMSDVVEIPLTIKQEFIVKAPEKEINLTGTYEISAMDQNVPMPEDAKNGSYSFSLQGEQAETTISFFYTHAGTYQYQLKQITAERECYQYDKSCYAITVYVKNAENGKLFPQVMADKGDGKKSGELKFENVYQGKESGSSKPSRPGNTDKPGKPVKTGDTANIMMYACIVAGMFLLIVVLIVLKRHKWKKQ